MKTIFRVLRETTFTAAELIIEELKEDRGLFNVIFNKNDSFTVEVKKELPLKSDGAPFQFIGLNCDLYMRVMKEKRSITLEIPQPERTEVLKFEKVLFERRES